jgi:acyl carrier protein
MNEDKIIKIFSEVLKLDKSKVSINTTAEQIEQWDSLGHLAFLSAIDEATSGEASKIENLGAQKSLKNILDLLNKNNL